MRYSRFFANCISFSALYLFLNTFYVYEFIHIFMDFLYDWFYILLMLVHYMYVFFYSRILHFVYEYAYISKDKYIYIYVNYTDICLYLYIHIYACKFLVSCILFLCHSSGRMHPELLLIRRYTGRPAHLFLVIIAKSVAWIEGSRLLLDTL